MTFSRYKTILGAKYAICNGVPLVDDSGLMQLAFEDGIGNAITVSCQMNGETSFTIKSVYKTLP